ncbi:hypothetical protein [Methanocalculus sp.]|jgi:hypothetical protein|uniref:hypothetical protein n=1 Tax=Methanocalculus sp. TaxID=2004547 RepID=UPI00178FB28F|nr:hypothetical protein [Methanocalculus sp.]HIJ05798.1 hypothetical protein [Methanocalculus sp.]
MISQEHATKRIPVRQSTWEEIQRLREPGQTYDDVIVGLIREGNRNRLYDETDRIMKRGKFAELPREL